MLSNKLIPNKTMLITYPDSIGGELGALQSTLNEHFSDAGGGIHVLPFFPSSGDRGFSPVTYSQVDANFGTWDDITELSKSYYLMCDIMVNHISRQSSEFQDFLKNGDASIYAKMFLDYQEFWGESRPNADDMALLYRRKDGEPYQTITFPDGKIRKLWCTFTPEQLDIDTTQPVTRSFLIDTLNHLAEKGISIIRLDAYGYVSKQKDTSCFFVEPVIWELITYLKDILAPKGVFVLPEVHDTWQTAKKFEAHDLWSYDFVMPFLMLHTIYSKDATKLVKWLEVCPRTQFTVLDTHDGVGVHDAYDWVDRQEAEYVIKQIEGNLSYSYKPLNPEKKRFFESYQLYGTYYSMLQEQDEAYLLARAVQFFAPGIPQIYYVGMLAGKNDLDALRENQDHRSINRHNYTCDEVKQACQRPVVQGLIELMRFRNTHLAFDGEFEVSQGSPQQFRITRRNGVHLAILDCDLGNLSFNIQYCEDDTEGMKTLEINRFIKDFLHN